jgi:SAM-dependent methyltransferase
MMEQRAQKDDWDEHWARYAASAAQNPAQTLRHTAILRALRGVAWPLERLLDVGSGQGDFMIRALHARVAREYAGFELSATGVALSCQKVPSAAFLRVDLFAPPVESELYRGWATAAVCSDVIEHVDDPVTFLRALGAYLAPGGTLIVTVPGGPMSKFDHHIGHRRHYSDRLVRSVLSDAGYEVERVWLAGFPFFNLYRLLVMARGDKLAADVEASDAGGISNGIALFAMRLFSVLFRFNLAHASLGWQVVARARKR